MDSAKPGYSKLILGIGIIAVLGLFFGGFAYGKIRHNEKKFGFSQSGQPFTIVSTTSSQPATTTRMFGSVTPQVNNLYDLGSGDFSWRNIYASGTVISGGTVTSTFSGPVSSTRFIANPGSAVQPAFTFSSDENTGAYTVAADIYGISTGGGNRLSISSTAAQFAPPLQVDSANTSTFAGAVTSTRFCAQSACMYSDGNEYTVSIGGVRQLRITAGGTVISQGSGSTFYSPSGVIQGRDGTTDGTLGFAFISDASTGLRLNGIGQLRFVAQGVGRMNIASSTGIQVALGISPTSTNALDLGSADLSWRNVYVSSTVFTSSTRANVGSAGNPTFTFAGDPDSGHYNVANTGVYTSVNGVAGLGVEGSPQRILSFFDVIPSSNNVRDLGTSVLSWQDFFASGTEIVLGGLTAEQAGDTAVCRSTTGTLRESSDLDCSVSARRFKDNIVSSDIGLAELMKLEPVTFTMKEDESGRVYVGLIADDAAAVDPKLATYQEDGQVKSLDKHGFLAMLVGAIQELVAKITGLEARMNQQQREIDELKLLIQHKK